MTTFEIVRSVFAEHFTLGQWLVQGRHECWTLEDRTRPLGAIKVPGQTSIPPRTYEIKLEWSPTYQRLMPYLQNVDGFTKIMIHWGNTPADSRGCILVGRYANKVKGALVESLTCQTCKKLKRESTCKHAAFNPLFDKIQAACSVGPTFVRIVNEGTLWKG